MRNGRIKSAAALSAEPSATPGYPVEFWTAREIFNTYGEEGITKYELDPVSGIALISDDTQMTLFTANGILFGMTREQCGELWGRLNLMFIAPIRTGFILRQRLQAMRPR